MYQRISISQAIYIWHSLILRMIIVLFLSAIAHHYIIQLRDYIDADRYYRSLPYLSSAPDLFGVLSMGLFLFGWILSIYYFFNRKDVQEMFYKKQDIVA